MPIVDIELVADRQHRLAADVAQSMADAVGEALDSPRGQAWVRLRVLPREQYAENGSTVDAGDLPVFVTVLRQTLPERAALVSEIAALTGCIAKLAGRNPASVHIEYAPAAAGRLAFGGGLVG